jgi:membrane protease YdiL (CAAX protease family)
MRIENLTNTQRKGGKSTIVALVGLVTFLLISFLSQFAPLLLHVMVITGIAFPLVWGKWTGSWREMGFTKRHLGRALLWGVGSGIGTSLIGLAVAQEPRQSSDLGLELAVSIPAWLFLASPFQEFFFRGWLQSLLQENMGMWRGLVLATLAFTAWHYLWPLASHSSFPLSTIGGFLATFVAGLIYGYSFQRTQSVIAPWLAHAVAGVIFVIFGVGSFIGAQS